MHTGHKISSAPLQEAIWEKIPPQSLLRKPLLGYPSAVGVVVGVEVVEADGEAVDV